MKEMKENIREHTSENSKRFNKVGNHSSLIKNYEIRIRGKWMISDLPFAIKEYFVCHEDNFNTTTIGATIQEGKTRKDILKAVIDLQKRLYQKDTRSLVTPVDMEPLLRAHPRWDCIKKTHFKPGKSKDEYFATKDDHSITNEETEKTRPKRSTYIIKQEDINLI
jgi:UDP-2,3-diacylglucosamine pyrophosphatase LpxH